MRVVLSCPTRLYRLDANGHLWGDDWQPFISYASSIRAAHYDLALHAVAEGWDESVRVSQDDVYVREWRQHRMDVTSYQRPNVPDHVCPRAFTATPAGWLRLAEVWSQEGKTCELWHPDCCYATAEHVADGHSPCRRIGTQPLP